MPTEKPRAPEHGIQAAILTYLSTQKRDTFAWRNNSGALVVPGAGTHARRFVRYGMKGSADIIGVCRGIMFALEVKQPGRYPTPDQKAFLAEVTRCGGIGTVVRSVDDAMDIINRIRCNRSDASSN